MELRLTDNSKLSVTRLADDRLKLELFQPRTLKDGHGFSFVGEAILEGETLEAFLAELHAVRGERLSPPADSSVGGKERRC